MESEDEEKAVKTLRLDRPPKTGREHYTDLEKMWRERDCDFTASLRNYNSADVILFREAIQKND